MDSGLCIQVLVVTLALVKCTLVVSLFFYWRYQKTYPGVVFWLASFCCSAGVQLLYFFRGKIPDFWTLGLSNILLVLTMTFLFEGVRLFNGAASVRKANLWAAAGLSAIVLYFTLFQNQVLPRTLLITAMFLGYTFLIARSGWRNADVNQRAGFHGLIFFLLLDGLFRLIRLISWIGDSAPTRWVDPSLLFVGGFVINMTVAIGTAFCLLMINGSRCSGELLREREKSLVEHDELLQSQQHLRQAIRFSPFPLMVHAEDGEVLQLSEAWTDISGYWLADIPDTAEWTRRACGERQPSVMKGMEHLYQIQQRVNEGEFTIRTRNGEERIWDFSSAPLGTLTDGRRIVISMAADVTERKIAEQQLLQLNRELERRVAARTAELDDLYNNAPCGYHSIDAEGFFVRINDTELKWLGQEREQILGRSRLTDWVSPESVPVLEAGLQTLKKQGFTHDISFALCGADGKQRQVIGGATAIYDSEGSFLRSRSTMFDVTERQALDYQMKQKEQLLRNFLDEASDPVHITDSEGRFVYVNKAWCELFGYSREQAENLSLYDVTGLSEHLRWDNMLQEHQERAISERSDYVFVNKDGQSLFIETVVLFRYERGIFAGTQAILIDVTSRRKMEAELREGQLRLSIANHELERVSRLKDDFLASMSHELRTPLTAVIGLSEILQDGAYGVLPPEQSEVIGSIERSGRHLLALINDILDLSKLEAKQVGMELEVCSAVDVGQASLQFIKSMAMKKTLSVEFEAQPESIALQADPRRLKQMLINLLSNAVKFTPDGGKIGLLIQGDEAAGTVNFTVWDTGIGIHDDDMEKLFQPFVQIDRSLGRQYSGTGLGLVLVQKAALMHNGKVFVKSEPGEGSRFTIELPWQQELTGLGAVADDDPESPLPGLTQNNAADSATIPVGGEFPLVLLAEDNPDNVEVIRGVFRNKPWRLLVAEDGVKAIELAKQSRPDIILMDVQMPNMDGLTAMRQLRRDPDSELAQTPIIALTALAMKGDRDRCLEAGADDYLSKPVDFKLLLEKMQNLAGKN